jgi:hypothetical protein
MGVEPSVVAARDARCPECMSMSIGRALENTPAGPIDGGHSSASDARPLTADLTRRSILSRTLSNSISTSDPWRNRGYQDGIRQSDSPRRPTAVTISVPPSGRKALGHGP